MLSLKSHPSVLNYGLQMLPRAHQVQEPEEFNMVHSVRGHKVCSVRDECTPPDVVSFVLRLQSHLSPPLSSTSRERERGATHLR